MREEYTVRFKIILSPKGSSKEVHYQRELTFQGPLFHGLVIEVKAGGYFVEFGIGSPECSAYKSEEDAFHLEFVTGAIQEKVGDNYFFGLQGELESDGNWTKTEP